MLMLIASADRELCRWVISRFVREIAGVRSSFALLLCHKYKQFLLARQEQVLLLRQGFELPVLQRHHRKKLT